MRRRASGLPAGKTFDAWEPDASIIPTQTQNALRTLEWVNRAEVLVVCGPSGSGKSHFIEALGHLAIDQGKTVAWHTLESLAVMLRRHRADDSVSKAIARLIRADLIVMDDTSPLLMARDPGDVMDSFIFSGNVPLVRDVMVAGRWVVRDGQHMDQSRIAERYRRTVERLKT